MQQIKGSVLKARLAFVEELSGENALNEVLKALPEEDRNQLSRILTVKWYPFETGKRLDDSIVKVLGHGKPEFFERLGAASAEHNLGGIHSGFITPGNPEAFLEKAGPIYALYYETGRREYRHTGEREGVLITYDAETWSAPDCLTVVGWYRKALQMCGARGVDIVEEECRAKGGK
ncbi:MAG: TIGR02265 family protein, partial [Gemmatimonadales bacterium]